MEILSPVSSEQGLEEVESTQVTRRLVKELKTKIFEVEIMMNHEKSPLSVLGLKEAKVYLAKIRVDQFKIKVLVNCFPSNKQPRDKSASSDSVTDTKRQDGRASCSASKPSDEAKMDRNRSLSKQ